MKKKITVTIEEDLIKRLDTEREDVGRSLFLQRILEKKYGKDGKSNIKGVKYVNVKSKKQSEPLHIV